MNGYDLLVDSFLNEKEYIPEYVKNSEMCRNYLQSIK
jgi:hypothetical protein